LKRLGLGLAELELEHVERSLELAELELERKTSASTGRMEKTA
jgi:hypothetical protein